MADRRIGVAIIGAGMGAAPHAASLVDLAARARVIGVYSRSPDSRKRIAARFGFTEAADLDARRAIAAGKHVLVEKPLDVSMARSRELVELAEKAGVKLGLMLQYRARPSTV